MARVGYKDMRGYLNILEKAGLLKHVKTEVDLKHEIGAISCMSLDDRGPGIMFENIKGHPGGKLAVNIMSTTEQMALAFNTEDDDVEIVNTIHAGKANPIPPKVVDSAVCQEVVETGDQIDVYSIPTPIWHEKDGGPYIGTTAGIITSDPDTGYLNSGMYRCMIIDKNHISVEARGSHEIGEKPNSRGNMHGGHVDVLKWEQLGKNAPIAVAIGMDPMTTYVTAQGVPSAKVEHAEYAVAGSWLGEALEIVKCKTNDLLVPAWSEIVLEGEVLRDQRTPEGPWGENADIYAESPAVFLMKINAITHRKDPINYGLICRPLQDYPKFLMGGALKGYLMSKLDIVKDAYVFPRTGNRPFAVVAARVRKPEDVQAVVDAVATMPSESYLMVKPRWLVVLDEEAEIHDPGDLMWRLTLAVRPDKDVSVLDVEGGYVGGVKMMVIDATFRNKPEMEWGPGAGENEDPPVARTSKELQQKVRSRWKDYGLA
ncbi:MAG TPA: UbiD family decarboxylase [Chloroflexota bacterium]